MVALSDLQKASAPGSFDWYGEKIEFRYNPGKVTRDQMDLLDTEEGINSFLVETLESWNITATKGKTAKTLPITVATMKKLPVKLTARIFQTMFTGDDAEGEESGSFASS